MRLFSRRSLLGGVLSAAAATALAQLPSARSRSTKLPAVGPIRGDFVRYLDDLTETPVVRLTSLGSAALLPAPFNRFVGSSRNRFLVFSSDRGGAFAPYRVDLRSAAVQQLAEATSLDPRSVTLDAAERRLFFIDGGHLRSAAMGSRALQTLFDGVSAFALPHSGGPVFISSGKLQSRAAGVLADGASGPCIVSPDDALCLFTRGSGSESEFWFVPMAGGKARLLARGPVSFPFWSPDASSIIFLRQLPENGTSELHQASLDGNERLLSRTSRFAAFSPNHDRSAFVGASASRAQPLILLLLRSSQRELALCEHHAGDAASTVPVFSPDNRRVYFQSTREGKSAIYSVNTETLVESAFLTRGVATATQIALVDKVGHGSVRP